MSTDPIVIVGAGHAGVQAAASLRDDGFDGSIALIDAQRHKPYQRPPLSKAFMKGEATPESLVLRGDDFFTQRRIDLRLGSRVAAINRAARSVRLAGGEAIAYEHLILATGAVSRPFSMAGADLDGVAVLRTMDDAFALRERMAKAKNIVVIGAGFIGLEFAAVAVAFGHRPTVIDIAPRVMGRAVSPMISAAFEDKHRALGATFQLGASIAALEGADGRVASVRMRGGEKIPADLVVIGVGVLANDMLAREADLEIDNGVAVDAHLLTSDEHISAIGDNASFPLAGSGRRVRLEAVQNALDQARCVARRLTGRPAPYDATPWFWSDQADYKLQIAGVAFDVDDYVARGDPQSGRFSVFGVKNDKVVVVESINRPADHMAARRILADASLTRAQAMDDAYDLKAHALRGARGA